MKTKRLIASGLTATTLLTGGGVVDYQQSLAPIINEPAPELTIVEDGVTKYPVIVQMDRGRGRERFYRLWMQDTDTLEKNHERDYHLIDAYHSVLTKEEIEELRTDPEVKVIQYDALGSLQILESIPYSQSGSAVHIAGATGSGVTVCVSDTGLQRNHYFFNGANVVGYGDSAYGYDKGAFLDHNGHGSHVAGIIASQDPYYRGVAPGVNLLISKVFTDASSFSTAIAVDSIEWCVDNGADIINMSWALSGNYTTFCDDEASAAAVNAAWEAGVLPFVASGNGGNIQTVLPPACASKSITVGAANKNGTGSSFSNGFFALDFAAVGEFVISAHSDPVDTTDLVARSGTSMATPTAAGLAALLMEADPTLTPAEIVDLMGDTATTINVKGNRKTGSGLINIQAAYNAVMARLNRPLVPEPVVAFDDPFVNASAWTATGSWTVATNAVADVRTGGEYVCNGCFYTGENDFTSDNAVYPNDCSSLPNQECVLTKSSSINLSAFTGAMIRVFSHLDQSLENDEYLAMDFYDGTSWREVWKDDRYDAQDNSTAYVWNMHNDVLSGSDMVSNAKIRFRAKVSDAFKNYEDGSEHVAIWMLRIEEYAPDPATQ